MLYIAKNIYHRLMPKALVLMYHRIDTLEADPWHLSVEPAIFEQHLEAIKEFGSVISCSELHFALQQKKTRNGSIVITFDDGYKDNLTHALPLLERHGLPATFFIPTNRLGQTKGYWWDELEEIIIHSKTLPQTLSLSLYDFRIDFDLEDETVLSIDKQNAIKKWDIKKTSDSRRTKLYMQLQMQLMRMSYEQQQEVLAHLRKWSGCDHLLGRNKIMTGEEVLKLAGSPLVTIGGHTTSHPDLSIQSNDKQEAEIADNKTDLEHLLNQQVDFFAYPYGRFNSSSPTLVANCGYKAAFTTTGWVVKNDSNPYLLNRLHVHNWTGDELLHVLNHFFYTPFK